MLDIKLSAINQTIENGPKPVTRQVRLLLFPETNSSQYYKIVFGRLIPWALIFIVVIRLLALAQNYFTDRKAKLYNQQGNQCISAWNDVYAHQNRSVKKAMDKAFLKAAH